MPNVFSTGMLMVSFTLTGVASDITTNSKQMKDASAKAMATDFLIVQFTIYQNQDIELIK